MKIPDRFQVFPEPVTLTYADQDRLAPHLGNWNKLNEVLLLSVPVDDLRRMVVLELMGKRRKDILRRLLPAIMRAERTKVDERIAALP